MVSAVTPNFRNLNYKDKDARNLKIKSALHISKTLLLNAIVVKSCNYISKQIKKI